MHTQIVSECAFRMLLAISRSRFTGKPCHAIFLGWVVQEMSHCVLPWKCCNSTSDYIWPAVKHLTMNVKDMHRAAHWCLFWIQVVLCVDYDSSLYMVLACSTFSSISRSGFSTLNASRTGVSVPVAFASMYDGYIPNSLSLIWIGASIVKDGKGALCKQLAELQVQQYVCWCNLSATLRFERVPLEQSLLVVL